MCIAEALEVPVLIVGNLGIERQIVQTSEASNPHTIHFWALLCPKTRAATVVGLLGQENSKMHLEIITESIFIRSISRAGGPAESP